MNLPYNDLNTYLRGLFGCRVQKIAVDAGLTCPNRDGTHGIGGCIYCNSRGSGTGAHARGLGISEQIRASKQFLGARYKAKKFMVYFQSFSNTYAPVEALRQLYDEALAVEDVVGLSIGTRPDCVNEAVLALLQHYARSRLIWVEYGLQSAHDATLARINRGHDFACFRDAVAATRQRGIKICAHVILGLPGENHQQMLETARILAGLGIDGVKIHLLYVVRGTPLEAHYRRNQYHCLTQDAYIDIVAEFLEYLPPGMIIQRLTSDPHADELVAPAWALQKQATLHLIRMRMAQRNSCQGMRFKAA